MTTMFLSLLQNTMPKNLSYLFVCFCWANGEHKRDVLFPVFTSIAIKKILTKDNNQVKNLGYDR